MKLFSQIKRALSLENSPIPKTHLYGLIFFAVAAVVSAPFLAFLNSDDDDSQEIEYDELQLQFDALDEEIADVGEPLDSGFDPDTGDLFSADFDTDGLGEMPTNLEWMTYTVRDKENLSQIFSALNLSHVTLHKMLKVDIKNSLSDLRKNEQIDFLIDGNGILRGMAVPLRNGQQEVLFIRDTKGDDDPKNDSYVSYVDPVDDHLTRDPEEVMQPRSSYKSVTVADYKDGELTFADPSDIFVNDIGDVFESIEKDAAKVAAQEAAEKRKREQEEKKIAAAEAQKRKAEEAAARKAAEAEAKKKEEAKRRAEIAESEKEQKIKYKAKGGTIIQGKITSGMFVEDAAMAGLTRKQMRRITDIFRGQINFKTDLKKGDTFKVLFDKTNDHENARILAVSIKIKNRNHNKFLAPDGKYYDELGASNALSTKFLLVPVKGDYRVTSPFNPRRYHPTLRRFRAHKGTDYAIAYGTKIFATADGTVAKVGHQFPGAGHYVVIDHGNNIRTTYMHMSKTIAIEGSKVKQGQVIGLVGQSGGISTGPHVHYQLEINGHAIDSTNKGLPIYNPVRKSSSQNKEFSQKVQQYKRQLGIK